MFSSPTSNQATKTSHLKSVIKEVGVERYLIKVGNIEWNVELWQVFSLVC